LLRIGLFFNVAIVLFLAVVSSNEKRLFRKHDNDDDVLLDEFFVNKAVSDCVTIPPINIVDVGLDDNRVLWWWCSRQSSDTDNDVQVVDCLLLFDDVVSLPPSNSFCCNILSYILTELSISS